GGRRGRRRGWWAGPCVLPPGGPSLDAVAVKPHRQRHQAPDLATQVLAAGEMAVEHPGHRGGVEAALALQRLRREHLASVVAERTAQPGGQGNREALLATPHDLARQQGREGAAQEALLGE